MQWQKDNVAEPHHQVFQRVSTMITKQLNLADEALVSRLIAKGCISENDRTQYTGHTKQARNRFISRLQNQPYKVFLAFIQCLKEDAKYSELVAVVEAVLAESDHTTAPTTDTASTSPDMQTEKNALFGPSLTTTG